MISHGTSLFRGIVKSFKALEFAGFQYTNQVRLQVLSQAPKRENKSQVLPSFNLLGTSFSNILFLLFAEYLICHCQKEEGR